MQWGSREIESREKALRISNAQLQLLENFTQYRAGRCTKWKGTNIQNAKNVVFIISVLWGAQLLIWFLRYARTLLAFYQCGLTCSAIDESSISLESIDESGPFLTLGLGTSSAWNENLRPLFNTNILPISGVLALGSEEKCFFSTGRRQNILFFSLSGLFISVLRVPEEKLAVHNFWGWALSGGGVFTLFTLFILFKLFYIA